MHLIVDEGAGREADGAEHGPEAEGGLGEEAEVAHGVLLRVQGQLLHLELEVGRGLDAVCLRDPAEDLRGLLGPALGHQPPRGLGQHPPREEEEGERRHGDHLDDLPGGDQVTCSTVSSLVLCSAPSVPQPVVQSRRRPLLGPSPG